MPAWTRANYETEIVDRVGPRLAYVGMATTTAGTNADLNGPIRKAAQSLGVQVAGYVVTDADLSALVGGQSEQLADLATLQAYKAILGHCTRVDFAIGQDSQSLSQFMDGVRADMQDLEDAVARNPYGVNLPQGTSGAMAGSFMPNDPFAPRVSRSLPGHWPYP